MIVQLVDVWKNYDGVQALQGLDLEIYKGEIFGLIGPNGAGKTTTLKIIVGILRKDKGLVKVKNFNIDENPYEYKRYIGYVPETVSLPDYLTLEEFLTYSGKIRDITGEEITDRIDYFLRIFELEKKRKALILSLSRGMKQKAAMASALIHDPDLIILDEPFVGIDPEGQRRIKDLFNEMTKESKTIFISTHMLDTAERLCDRVAIIHKGKRVASGDLSSLQKLSRTGEDATLEEVFLRLTQEAVEPYPLEPAEKKPRFRFFKFLRKLREE